MPSPSTEKRTSLPAAGLQEPDAPPKSKGTSQPAAGLQEPDAAPKSKAEAAKAARLSEVLDGASDPNARSTSDVSQLGSSAVTFDPLNSTTSSAAAIRTSQQGLQRPPEPANKHLASATHSMYIMHLPTTVRKGRCVKKFNCTNEFILSLVIRLEAVPMRRSNLVHLAIAGMPASHLPSISVLPGRVKVTVVGGVNVPVPDKGGIYAVAVVLRRPDTLFKTNKIYGDANPTWNETQELAHLRDDETLEFSVFSKSDGPDADELVGKALLSAGAVYPAGFEGKLELIAPVQEGDFQRKENPAERAPISQIQVSINTDKACRLSAKMEQDGAHAEIQALSGIPLQEDVKVEFRLFLVPKDQVPEPQSPATATSAAKKATGWMSHQFEKVERAITAEASAVNKLMHKVDILHLFPEKRKHTKTSHQDLMLDGEYMMTLRVNGKTQQVHVPDLHVPQPARIFAYMGGPGEPAARAVISSGMYSWTSHDMKQSQVKDKSTVSFDLPQKEEALLKQVREEIENNKTWRVFDMIFGFVLLFNGACIGLQLELESRSPGLVPKSTWDLIDNILLGIFTLEFVSRAMIMGRTFFKKFDLWLAFDAFVIMTGYIFLIFEKFIVLPFPVSVLRLLRLFKLAKMVRLVRAFRALGILVEALSKSFSTLFWTLVLLAMMVFVGGVLIVNLVEWQFANPTPAEQELLKPWFQVSTATWELLVMTTFDNWADTVRLFAFEIGGFKATLTAICFLIILFFTAIGICNMVVGVMCNTAFMIIQKDTRMKSAGQLSKKQEALSSFRGLLKTYNDRPLFKSDRFIGSDELLQACSEQVGDKKGKHDHKKKEVPQDEAKLEMRVCLKTLELGSSDLLGLVSIFDEDGQIEIDGLVEAIAIVQLQRYFGNLMTANDMIFGKTGLGVRPIDMLFFAFSTREMEASIRSTERSVMGLCSLTMDILHCLDERTRQANSVARLNMAALDVSQARLTAKQIHKWEISGRKPIGIRPLCKYVTQYRTTTMVQGITLHLDIVFGVFIVLNGALVGLQTTDTEDVNVNLFYTLDVIFTILFVIELGMRAVLHASIQDLLNSPTTEAVLVETQDGEKPEKISPEDKDMLRTKELKDSMWFKIVPPWPEKGRRQVIRSFPNFLSNAFQLFDFVIVVVCVIDSLIFAQLRRANLLEMDPSVFSAVRIFRLVRLAKLLRIFKVFPQLQRLLYVIMSTARLVLFTMLIMLIVLYMFAILMIVCYGDAARVPSDSVHYHYFGGLLNAMLSGWQLLTFDDWDTLFDLARKDYPLTCGFVFLPTMIIGLMLMNMAVGVMCASAVSLVTRAARENQYEALLVFISAMGDLASLLQNELGTQTLLQEMIESVLNTPLRPKKTMHDSRHEGKLMKDTSAAAIKRATEPEFVAKLRVVFNKAKLQPVMIKHVFEKVDYERQGFVHVNTFITGALILKEDLAKLDVFASSTALRHMRAKCKEVSQKLVICHNKMEVLLQEMCCLIYRDDYDEKISKKPVNKDASKDFFRLGPDAKYALSRLAEWRGEGPLPTLTSMGRMNTLHGTGKLRNAPIDSFDECSTTLEGRSTQLRKEVDFGDIIIIEQTMGDQKGNGTEGGHSGGDRKVIPLPVQAVLSDTMVKVRVDRMVEVSKLNFEHFYIVRNTAEDKSKKKGEFAATLVQVPKAHFEPIVSQAVFEWDLTTKMKLRSKLEELEEQASANMGANAEKQSFSHGTKERIVELQNQENTTLLKHYTDLQQKVVYLIDRSLVFRHFHLWKSTMPSQAKAGSSAGVIPGIEGMAALGDKPVQSPASAATNATNASVISNGAEGTGVSLLPAAAAATSSAPEAGVGQQATGLPAIREESKSTLPSRNTSTPSRNTAADSGLRMASGLQDTSVKQEEQMV